MRTSFKKIIALLLAVTLTFSFVPAAYAEETEEPITSEAPIQTEKPVESAVPVLCGDANNSGDVTAEDALIVLKHVVKLHTIPDALVEAADVTEDNKIDATDALMILKYVVKLIPKLPWSEGVIIPTPTPTPTPTSVPTPSPIPTLVPTPSSIPTPVPTPSSMPTPVPPNIDNPTPPSDFLNQITNYVKNNGETDVDGSLYIYDVYEETSGTVLQQMIPQIVYDEETGQIIFASTWIYYNSANELYFVEMVEMMTDGDTATAVYILNNLDEEGELTSLGALGTTFSPGSVHPGTPFSYETLYPEGTDLVSLNGWTQRADEGLEIAFNNWDKFLESHFYISISDIGFSHLAFAN